MISRTSSIALFVCAAAMLPVGPAWSHDQEFVLVVNACLMQEPHDSSLSPEETAAPSTLQFRTSVGGDAASACWAKQMPVPDKTCKMLLSTIRGAAKQERENGRHSSTATPEVEAAMTELQSTLHQTAESIVRTARACDPRVAAAKQVKEDFERVASLRHLCALQEGVTQPSPEALVVTNDTGDTTWRSRMGPQAVACLETRKAVPAGLCSTLLKGPFNTYPLPARDVQRYKEVSKEVSANQSTIAAVEHKCLAGKSVPAAWEIGPLSEKN
jgi:hypothetical protein